AEWNDLSAALAGRLVACGVGRGDVVALLLPTTPFYKIAYLAAARLGAIATGINLRYRRVEIGHILERSGARLLLGVEASHGSDFVATIDGLRDRFPELRETLWLEESALQSDTRAAVQSLAHGTEPVAAVAARPE